VGRQKTGAARTPYLRFICISCGLQSIAAHMNLVAEASNGREAIRQFRQHRPDITLMNLQIPEMNGMDAIVVIRKELPEAKIIILTTYESDVEGAMKLDSQDYLYKLGWIRNSWRPYARYTPGTKCS
jgi:DNA-binding NarL/FixJ family response regulator